MQIEGSTVLFGEGQSRRSDRCRALSSSGALVSQGRSGSGGAAASPRHNMNRSVSDSNLTQFWASWEDDKDEEREQRATVEERKDVNHRQVVDCPETETTSCKHQDEASTPPELVIVTSNEDSRSSQDEDHDDNDDDDVSECNSDVTACTWEEDQNITLNEAPTTPTVARSLASGGLGADDSDVVGLTKIDTDAIVDRELERRKQVAAAAEETVSKAAKPVQQSSCDASPPSPSTKVPKVSDMLTPEAMFLLQKINSTGVVRNPKKSTPDKVVHIPGTSKVLVRVNPPPCEEIILIPHGMRESIRSMTASYRSDVSASDVSHDQLLVNNDLEYSSSLLTKQISDATASTAFFDIDDFDTMSELGMKDPKEHLYKKNTVLRKIKKGLKAGFKSFFMID